MTEKEARVRGHRLKIGRYPMSGVARAIERGETAGLMKIVVDASNDRILGASILASEGGELVQILGAVMLANQPYTLLKGDRKSTRLNSSHGYISYAVFCLKKKEFTNRSPIRYSLICMTTHVQYAFPLS